MNKVIILATLTRDPELRYTPKGTAICKLGIAQNRKWKTESGEEREDVLFADVDCFGKQAETVAKWFRKGSRMLVEGRLKLDQWEDKKTGEKRSKIAIALESFSFVDRAKTEKADPGRMWLLRRLQPATTMNNRSRFNMQTQYQKVREFMQAFGQGVPTEAALPSEKIREMRFRLIDEEREEWDTAKTEVDKFDAVLDLSYVILGAAIDIGIPEDQLEPRSRPSDYGLADINLDLRHATVIPFAKSLINMMLKWVEEEAAYNGWNQWTMEAGFNEVHRSNMSKMWTRSQVMTRLHLDGDIFYRPAGGGDDLLIVTNPSGKIIKSPSYSPANLGPILEGVK